MKKIRFGITGSGYMGRTHAEAIKRLGQTATLVAISGGSRAPALAAQYGAVCESSAEAMMRRKDIDAIVVTTPQSLHFKEVMLALETGKHVLIEKPIATSMEDCDRMIEAAARRKLVIAVGYNLRFRNNPPRARELIAANAIGQVSAIHHTMVFDAELFNTGNFGGNKSWIHLPENLGLVVDGLPHAIDTIRWLTGAEVKSVAGFCRTFAPGRQNKDTAVGIFEFSNGAICSVLVCFALPGPYPREYSRYSIIGTGGLLDMDAFGDLHLSDRKEGWRLVTSQPQVGFTSAETAFGDVRMKAYCDQMQSFIDGIEGRPMTAGSGADGRAGLAACLALFEASQENRVVHL